MIKQGDWIMIRSLHNEGLSKSEIARQLNINRETVSNNLDEEKTPKYTRKVKDSEILDDFKEYIKLRLNKYNLTGQKLYEEIEKQGYKGGYQTVVNFVSGIKRIYKSDAVMRFETLPGQQGQVDWGHFGEIYNIELKKTVKVYCFFMILGYSRMKYIEYFTNQDTTSFLKGHNNAFKYFSGYPKEILYDNLKSVVIKRALRQKDSEMNKRFMDYAGYYGLNPVLCRPYRPQTKGKVENSVNYARMNFFAGEEFKSVSEMNEKARDWLNKVNGKIHNTTREKPFDRLPKEDLLKVNKYYDLSEICYREVFKDCHFTYKGNKYSVPHKYANKEVTIKVSGLSIEVFHRNKLITIHEISSNKGQYITNKEHFEGLRINTLPPKMKAPEAELDIFNIPRVNVETRSLKIYEEVCDV